MTKRMLIDSTHAEETRVVVLDGNRLEDFDVETSTKKQLKGNIYLAKVVRVEPSLQAAFVEYGGGRHGFLAFGEIHPDYYQIPVADRQRLLRMQAEEARAAEEDDEPEERPNRRRAAPAEESAGESGAETGPEPEAIEEFTGEVGGASAPESTAESGPQEGPEPSIDEAPEPGADRPAQPAQIEREMKFAELGFGETHAPEDEASREGHPDTPVEMGAQTGAEPSADTAVETVNEPGPETEADTGAELSPQPETEFEASPDLPPPEIIGGESDVFEGNGAEEARARRSSRFLRNYRIQEVIRRRQIMLIQVVKEERGTKGAALTTYISLAGRFCVLMPNSPRGGGISRKITSVADRRRLKEITAELEIPQGMGLIVRTAGAARPKPEIKRDCEYLMRLWDDIREHTLRSTAPALIYEEASLIKRTIRDVYSRDVDEVLVDGEEGWKAAHDFMRMLMPSHAKKVQLWRNGQPLFSSNGVEAQLDAMLSPTVQLRSGGYLVINQAEALVAIDVNSGRSTRERGIEETALRTNLEAADEVARQLRLRDLAGLIVIDFIDMEANKHNAMVERRLKEALKNDRARIQLGHISHFGLLEMSRQRLRPSLAETNFVTCPHCAGLGHVRSIESSAIHVLRGIEEEGGKGRAALIMVHCANAIAMYLLNNKRDRLAEIEARTAMRVHFTADETLVPPEIRIERLRPQVPEAERAPTGPVAPAWAVPTEVPEVEAEDVAEEPAAEAENAPTGPTESAQTAEENEHRRRRRRRRRGGRRDGSEGPGTGPTGEGGTGDVEAAPAEGEAGAEAGDEAALGDPALAEQPSLDPTELDENGLPRARRRGRRGGRRRRREGGAEEAAEPVAEVLPPPPVYVGPTPADPFGGHTYDIFDMIDRVEEEPPPPAPAPVMAVPEPEAVEPATQAIEAPVETPVETSPEPKADVPEPTPEVIEPVPVVEAEPPRGPVVKPIVVGQDPVPEAAPKRGWWRR